MATAVRWTGRSLVVAASVLWLIWMGWRITSPMPDVVGVLVLVLEVVALVVALVVSAALWSPSPVVVTGAHRRAAREATAALPVTLAVVLGLDPPARTGNRPAAVDDTGPVDWARDALRSLHAAAGRRGARTRLADIAWSLVAVEGMRRMVTVLVVVGVLISGNVPFDAPPTSLVVLLLGSQVLLTLGHWLLSDGLLRPGARLRWSMASIGAGFGDGRSRTGLPVRWTATLATIVTLNIAVSLRGLSDRWTHGLGAMPHDQRVMTMLGAAWLVGWAFVALRSLPQPQLGYYGATRRLEEPSTRRLALGATLTVAAIGLLAGVLPGAVPA